MDAFGKIALFLVLMIIGRGVLLQTYHREKICIC